MMDNDDAESVVTVLVYAGVLVLIFLATVWILL